jgi:Fic family protein
MRVLLRAIEDLHLYLARKAREKHDAEALLRRASAASGDLNPRPVALLRHAMKTPSARYTISSHRVSHGVTYQTARTDLLRLAALGYLEQKKMSKKFVFTPAAALSE